jgi:hypothetical protein
MCLELATLHANRDAVGRARQVVALAESGNMRWRIIVVDQTTSSTRSTNKVLLLVVRYEHITMNVGSGRVGSKGVMFGS